MTNAQTEARALWAAVTEEVICNDGDAIEMIAAALAAKDAELEKVRHMLDLSKATTEAVLERAERAEAQLAEANKALEFYANPIRYNGPNQRNSGNDPYSTGPYILSVERDNGEIARRAREQGGR